MIEDYLKYHQVVEYLSSTLGVHYHESKINELIADLPEISRKLGFDTVEECLNVLITNNLSNEKLDRLVSIITIGETYFFRDSTLFSSLRNAILPELISKKEQLGDKRIRILSAGCSTGEEAYSIAIILRELVPDIKNWNIVILGVDINPKAIETAHNAVYSKWSFRQVDDVVISKYFRKEGSVYHLNPEIKQMVSFSIINLVSDVFPSLVTNTTALDIVFCRNVLMYFRQETINKVVEKFSQSLLYDGYLFVASAELALINSSSFKRISDNNLMYFRKMSPITNVITKIPPPRVKPRTIIPVTSPNTKIRINYKDDDLKSHIENMRMAYIKGDYQVVGEYIHRIYQIDAKNVDAVFYEIKILCNTGELAKAKELTEQFLDWDKLNTLPYILNALILVEEGETNEALKYIDKALYLDPDLFIGNYMKGNLLSNGEMNSKATKFYKNALEILQKTHDEEIVPYTDGIPAGRLKEIIQLRLNA